MAKKKRPVVPKKPSTCGLDADDEDSQEGTPVDNCWDEVLGELALAEDTDPFAVNNEIQLSLFLIRLARELVAHDDNGKSNHNSAQRMYWSLYRRKQGITALRKLVIQRFQECKSLLDRLPELIKLREIELQRRLKKRRKASKKESAGNMKGYSGYGNEIPEIDSQPIRRLSQTLSQLDQCLEMLEGDATEHTFIRSPELPDFAACLGLGLAFGLQMGFTAGQMTYHSALTKEAKDKVRLKQLGIKSKSQSQSQNREKAAVLVSAVLAQALLKNVCWDNAYKNAGVGLVNLPSKDTVRRLVEHDIESLLQEIDDSIRTSSLSASAAFAAVARAWKKKGYQLNSQILQKLVERDRSGTLPGRRLNGLQRMAQGKLNRKFQQKLHADFRAHSLLLGDVIGLAIDSYDEE